MMKYLKATKELEMNVLKGYIALMLVGFLSVVGSTWFIRYIEYVYTCPVK